MVNAVLTAHMDHLWDIFLFHYLRKPTWSGMMQSLHQSVHQRKSSVLFLPMIDLDTIVRVQPPDHEQLLINVITNGILTLIK